MRLGEDTERSRLRSNLYGLPDAVRITLAFDASQTQSRTVAAQSIPTKSTTSASTTNIGKDSERPLLFQKVVFLNLAARANASSYLTNSNSESENGDNRGNQEGSDR